MKTIAFFSDILIITWKDGRESIIAYSVLRKLCPCAFCGGEKDVLGNQYGGVNVVPLKDLYILKYEKIGHYGLQFYFSDNHKDGIYSYDLLKKINK